MKPNSALGKFGSCQGKPGSFAVLLRLWHTEFLLEGGGLVRQRLLRSWWACIKQPYLGHCRPLQPRSRMAGFRWGYFLNREELINTYRSAGGKIGTFSVTDPNDMHHARRAIAECLIPGPFCVWYASLDGYDGIVFFVGKPDQLDLRKAVDLDLAARCYTLFHRPPDPCEYVENSYGQEYDLYEKRSGDAHSLRLIEVLQSSRFGDHYPLREYEIPPHQRHLMRRVSRPL